MFSAYFPSPVYVFGVGVVGDYFGGDSGGSGACRNVARNDGSCSDSGVVAYFHVFDNADRRPYVHVVAYRCGRALVAADVEKLADVAVITDFGARIYHYPYAVPYVESVADFDGWRYLYAVETRQAVVLQTGDYVERIFSHAES